MDLNEHAPANSQELLSAFVSELFLSATKQAIREERRKKQAEGIAKAKAKGVSFGRKSKPLPDNFEEARQLWLSRELNLKDAAKHCGLPESTFYDAVRRLGEPVSVNHRKPRGIPQVVAQPQIEDERSGRALRHGRHHVL